MPKIGFIGLGLMGRAMVGCLQDAGFDLVVLGNRDRTGVDAALARGATEAHSARGIAEASDIVMICVGTSEQVEARMLGDDGVLAGAREGHVVMDFGTSRPDSTIRLAAEFAEKGAAYLDAPLGRTPAHAEKGQLNIMCAGDEAAFERVRAVLDVLGENVFYLGKSGNDHTIKLLNNFFAMTTACAMAEVFAMADLAGVERQAIYDVLAAGPNRSGMMDFIQNYSANGQIDLAFSVANGAKDVGYYRDMATALGGKSYMSGAALETLTEARESGFGDRNVPEMVDYLATHVKT